MTIPLLITGFEPFGVDEINPSLEAVKALPDSIGEYKLHKVELPVVYHKSWQVLQQAIDKYTPQVVILVGQAGGRCSISIERVAINIDDSDFPDNENNLPKDEPIVKQGPDSYFTTFPYRKMVAKLVEGGIPAYISDDAGTFICNHIMYQLLHYNKLSGLSITGGFIHVPYCTEQVLSRPKIASLTLDQITRGLQLVIESIVRNE